MNKLNNIIGLFLLTLATAQYSVQAQTLDISQIVKKANHAVLYQGDDGKAKIDMKIIDGKGRERNRQLTMIRKNLDDVDGAQKYYVYFSKPADIKKMVFMTWKNREREDDRWLYLPALDLVKRIAASDERTSFVGSHFFYEDVSGRDIDEDVHELLEETEKYYVTKSTPKTPNLVEFKYYKTWVDKQKFLPIKAEYFNDKEVIYRTYTVLDTQTIDSYATVTQAQIEDNISGGKTVLNYSSVKYNNDIPEKIFSERYLRRAPKKYLR